MISFNNRNSHTLAEDPAFAKDPLKSFFLNSPALATYPGQVNQQHPHVELSSAYVSLDKIEVPILEVLEDFGLCWAGEGSFSDQKVGAMAGLGTGLDDELFGAADEEDFGPGSKPSSQ
ncbi:hypothetical protein FF1_043535 [Malus domestica]